MSECVLCLGNWRKQTFPVESLISELQSKLWKWHLKALNHGPHPRWGVRNTSRKHTFPTHPGPTSRWEQYFSLQNGHLERMSLGWHSLGKKLQHHSFSRTKRYNLFLRSVLGARAVSRSPKAHFPSKVGHASCLWNIFFSYLRDKRDLHFPLNTHWLCLFLLLLLCFFFPQISDIWSNSNLFSCLTFSNNWAWVLAELVSIISERKSPHFYSVAGEQEGMVQCC